MLGAMRERVAAWRYEASADGGGKRDVRIDLLRGFCVFVMIVDHVGGESSWLYVFTGGNRFIVSAAEGFVLLSGFSMGMVYITVIHRKGVRAMFGKIFGRAWLLYTLTVGLTIVFAAVSAVLGTPWAGEATPARSRTDFAFSVLTLHRTYSLTDVLLLYTLLVLSAGPVLWLISHGHTALVLVASWSAWAARQIWPDRIPVAWQITDGGFPFSAWQVMFFSGLILGYHRQRLAPYFRPARLFALALAALAVLFVIETFALDVLAFRFGGGSAGVPDLLFDKNDARLGRIIALCGVAAFAYAAVTLAWVPVRRGIGWLLLTMGQRALFAYSVQLFVVAFFSSDLMAPVRLNRENALFQATAVSMVWVACLAQPWVLERWRRFTARARGPAHAAAG